MTRLLAKHETQKSRSGSDIQRLVEQDGCVLCSIMSNDNEIQTRPWYSSEVGGTVASQLLADRMQSSRRFLYCVQLYPKKLEYTLDHRIV